MEKVTLKTDHPVANGNSLPSASLLIYDLPVLIEKMKHDSSWTQAGLNAMILHKSPENQIVLTALPKDTEIKSCQSNEWITFQVLEGKLRVQIGRKATTLNPGQLLELHQNVKYRLTSKEETVFLLSIANRKVEPSEEEIPWCF